MAGEQRGRLVFVGGCPRSGTTLVQNMLDSHPMVAGGPEFDHVPDLIAVRNLLRVALRNGRISAFRPAIDPAFAELIERLLLPYAAGRQCAILSEKTPANVLHFRDLLEVLPDCRCIFVLRDPRAVVASMFEVGRRARAARRVTPDYTRSLLRALDVVADHNEAGFSVLDNERVALVRYESLVDDPDTETKWLAQFLDIPWDPAMTRPANTLHAGAEHVDDVWYTESMYQRNPDAAGLEQWRRTLNRRQQVAVEAYFASDARLSARGGYDLPPRPALHGLLTRAVRARRVMALAEQSARGLGRQLRRSPAASGASGE